MNNPYNIPTYIKKLHMEATFPSKDEKGLCIYGYVTYNKTKLRGPQLSTVQKYSIQAHGLIPITENEFLDMSLTADRNYNILDFHMTYVRTFVDENDTLLGYKFKQPVKRLNIRSDIGPHRGSPHIDVEIFNTNNQKIERIVVRQESEFPN
jgi:hypothetical protein